MASDRIGIHILAHFTSGKLQSIVVSHDDTSQAGLWLLTERIVLLLGVKAHVAYMAQQFATYSLIWLLPRSIFNVYAGYLDCQGTRVRNAGR